MVELDTPARVITNLPTAGLIEGPFPFERNGIYYLTYPHAATNTERLEYAMSTNPMGPYKQMGVILDEAAKRLLDRAPIHRSIQRTMVPFLSRQGFIARTSIRTEPFGRITCTSTTTEL